MGFVSVLPSRASRSFISNSATLIDINNVTRYSWVNRRIHSQTRARARPIRADPPRFLDFETSSSSPPSSPKSADEKAQELIDRMQSVLEETQAALEQVRNREPSDSKHRRQGVDIVQGPITAAASTDASPVPPIGSGHFRTHLTFLEDQGYDTDTDDDDEWSPITPDKKTLFRAPDNSKGIENDDDDDDEEEHPGLGPTSLNSWFGGKVDTGPLVLRQEPLIATLQKNPVAQRESLEFMRRPTAPSESQAEFIFPADMSLKFQSDVVTEEKEEKRMDEHHMEKDKVAWERQSGEERGPDGYWYRWTEIKGMDESGSVNWSEKWWEISDWRGMKELGAEKWGFNMNGDAWRETWREAIGVDAHTGQPTVERTAHKWAKNARGNEWEEKWGEHYLASGKADKWADKWARDGAEVWHEKWGEQYDGSGGCVKYTDKWAEREVLGGGAREQWGDKWEERFGHGKGTKSGETWSVSAGGERWNRSWGEEHFGDGNVRKSGSSTSGEYWDNTEHMDTYYEPVPHFGYDLALAHSPQLRSVPLLPREDESDLVSGGLDDF